MNPDFKKSDTSLDKTEKTDKQETIKFSDKVTAYVESVLKDPRKKRNIKRWSSNLVGTIFFIYLLFSIGYVVAAFLLQERLFAFLFMILVLLNLFFLYSHIRAKQIVKKYKKDFEDLNKK